MESNVEARTRETIEQPQVPRSDVPLKKGFSGRHAEGPCAASVVGHSESLGRPLTCPCPFLQRGWLTTPPGSSSPWRWQQLPDDRGPQGRMVLPAGQALQEHLGSLVKLAEKDGRACQE